MGSEANVAPEHDGPTIARTFLFELSYVATEGATVGSHWSSPEIILMLNLRFLLAFHRSTATVVPSLSGIPRLAAPPESTPWKPMVYVGIFFVAAPAPDPNVITTPESVSAPTATSVVNLVNF